jgi:hypothetical protein
MIIIFVCCIYIELVYLYMIAVLDVSTLDAVGVRFMESAAVISMCVLGACAYARRMNIPRKHNNHVDLQLLYQQIENLESLIRVAQQYIHQYHNSHGNGIHSYQHQQQHQCEAG